MAGTASAATVSDVVVTAAADDCDTNSCFFCTSPGLGVVPDEGVCGEPVASFA